MLVKLKSYTQAKMTFAMEYDIIVLAAARYMLRDDFIDAPCEMDLVASFREIRCGTRTEC